MVDPLIFLFLFIFIKFLIQTQPKIACGNVMSHYLPYENPFFSPLSFPYLVTLSLLKKLYKIEKE